MCAKRRLGSAWASTQSDQSLLFAWRNLGFLATHRADSEDSDQTGWMPRLIWVFAGRTSHFAGCVVLWSSEQKQSWDRPDRISDNDLRLVSDVILCFFDDFCHIETMKEWYANPLCQGTPFAVVKNFIWVTSWQTIKMSAPSEYSDQPGHPPSLIRVFTVRSMGS